MTWISPAPSIFFMDSSSFSISPSASSNKKSPTRAFKPNAIGSLAWAFNSMPSGTFDFRTLANESISVSESAGRILISCNKSSHFNYGPSNPHPTHL